jgi:thiamine biosynthesis lipoprotein
MGTLVTIHVVQADAGVDAAMERAFAWFHRIEACCTRFRADSELMQLTTQTGVAAPVSAILFEAVRFALRVAEESGGAFDPTVGGAMEARGFNREHRTREVFRSPVRADADTTYETSYRDVELDPRRRTILLRRALTLDLGGVAKGLAVDTAAHELHPFRDFAIDAGGDLYLGGMNPRGKPWSVGIRHPRRDGETIGTVRVSDQAVCTSGDYERTAAHILDPRNGRAADSVASATVVGSGAMLADALATAAFVLGPEHGIALLERLGVEGLIVTPQLEQYRTGGFGDVA